MTLDSNTHSSCYLKVQGTNIFHFEFSEVSSYPYFELSNVEVFYCKLFLNFESIGTFELTGVEMTGGWLANICVKCS